MQGTDPNPHTLTNFEHSGIMNADGAPEYVADPALYFPAANNFGYYYTGFESPNEWDDHLRTFSVDGTDVQYGGAQTDNLHCLYYTPTYGYGESPFNPYNPYIPGAMMGVDGSYVGTQYYAVSPYQSPISPSSYYPVAAQTKPDTVRTNSVDPVFDTASSFKNGVSSSETKHVQSSTVKFAKNPVKVGSSLSNSVGKTSEDSKANSGTSHCTTMYRNDGVVAHGPSLLLPQPQISNNNNSRGRDFSQQNQMKMPAIVNSAFSDGGSSTNGNSIGDGVWAKFYQGRTMYDTCKGPDSLAEQNRGPRTNRSKNQLVVKAYTKKAGNFDPQGNIIISADDYNKDDFLLDYVHAKFFVIKSYSEDDVHKSIKYSVWSSTPNGNKKLNTAYEDMQHIVSGRPSDCPIFLYFSVNASGQFCGVAEMVGPVDFQKDMDFWQQDKWSGSFPVKWHMIKDVPNMSFRHIILENNEYKPVTNSRDTQEIKYKPGMEMLKIFKNFTSKTSLLDDFLYYENRQKIMLEERARLLPKTSVSALQPEIISLTGLASKGTEQTHANACVDDSTATELTGGQTFPPKAGNSCTAESNSAEKQTMPQVNTDMVSTLKIGSLVINPKPTDTKHLVFMKSNCSAATKAGSGVADVVSVGSMTVKLNGHNSDDNGNDNDNSCRPRAGPLTVGTIPIDPEALMMERADASGEGGSVRK